MVARSSSPVGLRLVVRELPELDAIVEDVLFLATGTEYDADEVLPRRRVRADGEPSDGMLDDDLTEAAKAYPRER